MDKQVPILQIEGLNVRIAGKPVLENISFSMQPCLQYGLWGPNGGGKTTLLKAILGLIPTDSGKIFFLGKDLQKNPQKRRKIGYVPQRQIFFGDYPIEVEELLSQSLLTSLRPFRRLSKSDKGRLQYYLDLLGISHLRKQAVRSLSGGELQRALIARALLAEPILLLLDEPLSHLDPKSKENFHQILGKLSQNTAVLMVSHENLLQGEPRLDRHFAEVLVLRQRLLYRGSALEASKRLRELSKQWMF